MNEQRIVEYLRARGHVTPPVDFTGSVMSALDSAPVQPSRFSAYLPAFVAVGAAAVIAVLALLVGPGRDIGPAPSASATAEASTVDELRVALMASVDVLRDAPGVEGRQGAEIDGTLGTATWFDWRPNGDQVVVQRWDLDVTDTGWWKVPDGAPPATGQRIDTNIQAKIGDELFFTNEAGDWQVAARDDGFPTGAIGPAMLDGAILPWYPLMGLGPSFPDAPESDARVERGDLPDGGAEWQLEFQWNGSPLIQTWTIGPGGELRSWSMEREDRSVDPEGGFHDNATHVSLQLMINDGDPIEPPDVDALPDPAPFGLPADFPLGGSVRGTGGLEAAVTEAVAQLADSPGVTGVVTSTIGEYVASATWFDWRPNGDQVVVTRTDIDVSAPWWTDPDGRPLSVGERIQTEMSVAVGDEFYRAEGDTWVVEEGPRPLTFWTGVLEGRIPALGGFPPDAQDDRRDLADGTTVWVMVSGSDDGRTITEWTVSPDGALASVSTAVERTPTPEQAGSTTTTVEFTPLDDVGPVPVPDPDAAPDPAIFGLPDDFPF